MKDDCSASGPCPAVRPSAPGDGAPPLSRLLVLVAVAIALVIFVLPLAVRFPLLDPDEGLHASIAQEMVEQGDWITPRFLGEPFFDKPILYTWTEALSLSVFGFNEPAVRLPGLMFGLLGALTTALLAWRMFDRTTGLVAGILYATTILPTAMAQAASHDVALVPWINLGLLCLWQSHRSAKLATTSGCLLSAGTVLGLSILTKGLEGIAVVGLAYGGWLLWTRQIRWTVVLRGTAVLIVAAMVAAPWYLAVEWKNPGYLSYYFISRHLLGFATATQPHAGHAWWYYFPILLGGGLPWISYLPVLKGEKRRERGEAVACALPSSLCPLPLLWSWLVGWFVFLTLSQSKLATYLWPLFPAVAILAAVVWTRLITDTLTPAARQAFARTFVSSCWSGPILLPATVGLSQFLFRVHLPWYVWLFTFAAAALAPLPLVAWSIADRKRAQRSAWLEATLASAAVSMAVQFTVVMTLVLPRVTECFSARDLAAHFNQAGRVPTRLWLAEQRLGSLLFYLDPPLRAALKPDQIRHLSSNRPANLEAGDVVAVPDADRYHVVPTIELSDAPYQRAGHYRLYTLTAPLTTPTER